MTDLSATATLPMIFLKAQKMCFMCDIIPNVLDSDMDLNQLTNTPHMLARFLLAFFFENFPILIFTTIQSRRRLDFSGLRLIYETRLYISLDSSKIPRISTWMKFLNSLSVSV